MKFAGVLIHFSYLCYTTFLHFHMYNSHTHTLHTCSCLFLFIQFVLKRIETNVFEMKSNTNNSPLPIAFLSCAPPNHTIHPQVICWDFVNNSKHQMIQKAFTWEWLYILTFRLWVCLLLGFNPRPFSRRHRVVPPGGLRRCPSSLSCSLLSLLFISHF